MKPIMCEISECPLAADRVVTYNHSDPALRWTAPMCRIHAKDAFEKCGEGEYTFAGLDTDQRPTTDK
jgi:hypothetical protein